MKRSHINRIIAESEKFLEEKMFALPPFFRWTPADWARAGREADEIRAAQLGWDVTDFARGDFDAFGLVLFTLRNGNASDPGGKPYAEKILILQEGQ
ncbi:MAG TPA: D-lyxose/D-mannose family sugar isomerase, partial [bacterium]|nr:D-lyxose/D-mannose family sugar isomerase [bacterium]